jgi:hypothetical protein
VPTAAAGALPPRFAIIYEAGQNAPLPSSPDHVVPLTKTQDPRALRRQLEKVKPRHKFYIQPVGCARTEERRELNDSSTIESASASLRVRACPSGE